MSRTNRKLLPEHVARDWNGPHGSDAKSDRNNEIYQWFKNGTSLMTLARAHEMSRQRIWQIIKRHQRHLEGQLCSK